MKNQSVHSQKTTHDAETTSTENVPGQDGSALLPPSYGIDTLDRVLQPKLTINRPGDIYEQEADHAASQVMQMPAPPIQRAASSATTPANAPASVHQTLHSSGHSLDAPTRDFMEQRFGQDFSQVRVHTDPQAAESAKDIHAKAYTVGQDVVFGAGHYAPGTDEGNRLIAHELTHTIQQGSHEVRRAEAPPDAGVQAPASSPGRAWESVREFPTIPNRRAGEGMVYIFVAVTKPDNIAENTKAAAATAYNAVKSNPAIYREGADKVVYMEVASIEEFISAFERHNNLMRERQLQVRQLEVFSHGGLDGPIFGDSRRQFGINGAPDLKKFPVLPYADDAVVFFRGCRIGSGKFLEQFAGLQNVRTYGFLGTTSFSTTPQNFEAWKSGKPAHQLDFPGYVRTNRLFNLYPAPNLPRGYVPKRAPMLQREPEDTIPDAGVPDAGVPANADAGTPVAADAGAASQAVPDGGTPAPMDAGMTSQDTLTDAGTTNQAAPNTDTPSPTDAGTTHQDQSRVGETSSTAAPKPTLTPAPTAGWTPAVTAACPPAPTLTPLPPAAPTVPAPALYNVESPPLPTLDGTAFGGIDPAVEVYVTVLANYKAKVKVKGEVQKRFQSAQKSAHETAKDEAKKAREAALKAAEESTREKLKDEPNKKKLDSAIRLAQVTAGKLADQEAKTQEKATLEAVMKPDAADVEADLRVSQLNSLSEDFRNTMTAVLAEEGPKWQGDAVSGIHAVKKQQFNKLTLLQAQKTKALTPKPVKPKKGTTPPPPKSTEEIAEEVEAYMAPLRSAAEVAVENARQKWHIYLQNQLRDFAYKWMVGRREEIDFDVINQKTTPMKSGFKPSRSVPWKERMPIPTDLNSFERNIPVAPEVVGFLKYLQKLYPNFKAGNYESHGSFGFVEKNAAGKPLTLGYSVDLSLQKVPLDARGFWQPDEAIRFLLLVDKAAKEASAEWRVLYNDFQVAKAVNEKLNVKRVVFQGDLSKGKINWHGPIRIHFHLDIAPQKSLNFKP